MCVLNYCELGSSMAYYIVGTKLVEGNEDSTWTALCRQGMGVDPANVEHGFRLYVGLQAISRWRGRSTAVPPWIP